MVSPFVFSVFFFLGDFFWALPLSDLINFRLLLVSPSVDTCGIFLFAIFVEQGVVYLVLPALKHSYFINPVELLLYCYWRKVTTRFCCCWGGGGGGGWGKGGGGLRFWFLLLLLPFCFSVFSGLKTQKPVTKPVAMISTDQTLLSLSGVVLSRVYANWIQHHSSGVVWESRWPP